MPDDLLRVMYVDDEEDAIDIFKKLLNDSGMVSEVITISDPRQVECMVQKHQPDLLFLDIEMPHYDGISLLKNIRLNNQELEVVYVTSHEIYLLNAIKLDVVSYLLKPVNRHELFEILERMVQRNSKLDINGKNKIKLPVKNGIIYLEIDEIFLLEADGNYTKIFTTDNQIFTSSYNLGRIEQRIPGKHFMRINRKHYLNSKFLVQINKRKLTCIARINKMEFEYEVSRSFIKKFNVENF